PKARKGVRLVKRHVRPRILVSSLPNDLNGSPTGRRRRDGELQFVSGEGEKALLISPIPIRERAAVDTNEDGSIRLVYRVCAKVRDGSLRRGFVFLRGTLHAVVDRECRKVRTHDRNYIGRIRVWSGSPRGIAWRDDILWGGTRRH